MVWVASVVVLVTTVWPQAICQVMTSEYFFNLEINASLKLKLVISRIERPFTDPCGLVKGSRSTCEVLLAV